VVVSTELDEVLALADKVAVMYRGKIVDTVTPDTPRERIGLLMAGITGDGQPRDEERAASGAVSERAAGAAAQEPQTSIGEGES
jgi:simple sugar transport system ATP-binding protein